jgi:hypothetical protein
LHRVPLLADHGGGMLTIGDIVSRVMPRGTNYERPPARNLPRAESTHWNTPPIWPPDVFAVAASIVRHSECYTHGAVRGGLGLGRRHAATVRRIGRRWADHPDAPSVQDWLTTEWNVLISAWEETLEECADRRGALKR